MNMFVASAAQFHWAGQDPGVSYLIMLYFIIIQLTCAQLMIPNHGPMLLKDDGELFWLWGSATMTDHAREWFINLAKEGASVSARLDETYRAPTTPYRGTSTTTDGH